MYFMEANYIFKFEVSIPFYLCPNLLSEDLYLFICVVLKMVKRVWITGKRIIRMHYIEI